jgi:hypothetical protein
MTNKEAQIKEREENIKQMVSDKTSDRKDMFVVDVPKSWEIIQNYKKIPISWVQVNIT